MKKSISSEGTDKSFSFCSFSVTEERNAGEAGVVISLQAFSGEWEL